MESGPYSPLIFLVPHHAMQKFHYSVSLLNISTVLTQLLIAAWTDREDLRREMERIQGRENDHHRRVFLRDCDSPDINHSPTSPAIPRNGFRRQGTLGAMTFTTISPKNQFKQLLALAKDKEMHMGTCSWIRAFQNVKKHKLFQLRQTQTCDPVLNLHTRRKQEDLLRL